MKLVPNMKRDLGENGALHIYYVKGFPLQMCLSSAFLCTGKVRCAVLGVSVGFWSSEAWGNCTSKRSGYADFRPKEEEKTGDGFKMSLNQNDSGSTWNWQN